MKGEMQLKVIYWVTPIGILARGWRRAGYPRDPLLVQLTVERGLPHAAHSFRSPALPPPFDLNMYCEEWGWGGVCRCPAPSTVLSLHSELGGLISAMGEWD